MNNQHLVGPYSNNEMLADDIDLPQRGNSYWYLIDQSLASMLNDVLENHKDTFMTILVELASGNIKSITVEIDKLPIKIHKKFS